MLTAEQIIIPGKETEFNMIMEGLMEKIRHEEPGCLRFDYVQDGVNPTRRFVWADGIFHMARGETPFAIITKPDRYNNYIEYIDHIVVDSRTIWARTDRLSTGIGA